MWGFRLRVLSVIVGAGVATVALAGPGSGFGSREWAMIGGIAILAWVAYFPLEFVLVSIGCCLIGGLFYSAGQHWFAWDTDAGGSARVVSATAGMLFALAILVTNLAAYRRGVASRSRVMIGVLGVIALGSVIVSDGPIARSIALQSIAAILFAPLGIGILLFKGNARGTPSLKHLLGGLWILIYLAVAQIVLLGIVAPFALVFTRDRWGLVRRHCSRGMRFMFRSFPYGRLEVIGVDRDLFTEPAVLVSNHQSSVDIPLILSLPADVRLLVSRRVWRTPVLGVGARCLSHVLVESGHPEITLGRCRDRLDSGAMIHGFPEGTRSEGAFPHRFRRGVFEIAWELGVDVVPIVLCNTRSCVARDGFWVGDFRMSVKALPRVTPATFDYSAGSHALMKHVQALVRDAVEAENRRILSDLEFLEAQVDGLYRFQSRKIRRGVRRELRTLREYLPRWSNSLASRHRVLVVEDGPGVISHVVSLPNLRMACVGWIRDPRMRVVAARSAVGHPMLSFASEKGHELMGVQFDAVVLGPGVHPEEVLPVLGGATSGLRVFLASAGDAVRRSLDRLGFTEDAKLSRSYARRAVSEGTSA